MALNDTLTGLTGAAIQLFNQQQTKTTTTKSYTLTDAELLKGVTDAVEVSSLSVDSSDVSYDESKTTWTITPEDTLAGAVSVDYVVSDSVGSQLDVARTIYLYSVQPTRNAGTNLTLPNSSAYVVDADGLKDKIGVFNPYEVKVSDLLAGFTDNDSSTNLVTNVTYSGSDGVLHANARTSYTTTDTIIFTPISSDKKVTLNYQVTDGYSDPTNAPPTQATAEFTLKSNTAPTGEVKISSGGVMVAKGITLTFPNNPTLFQDADGIKQTNPKDVDGVLDGVYYEWLVNDVPVVKTTAYNTYTIENVGVKINVRASFTDNLGRDYTIITPDFLVAKPTYALSVDKTKDVKEGDTVNLTLKTTSVPAGEVVKLTPSGKITSADFDASSKFPESITVSDKGETTVPLTFTTNDPTTEGTEDLVISIDNDATQKVTINVADTLDNPPEGTITINKKAIVGETLTFDDSTLKDLDVIKAGTKTYQWLIDGTPALTNAASYLVTATDIGKQIAVKASYTDAKGNAEVKIGEAVTVLAPKYTLGVTKNTVMEGETIDLSLTTANVKAGTIINITPAGTVNAADIESGFPTAFTVGDTDGTLKKTIKFLTDASKEDDETLTLSLTNDPTQSLTINVKNSGGSPHTGNIKISGDTKVGSTLRAEQGTLADLDGIGKLSYEWSIDGTAILSNSETYTVKSSDAKKKIDVKASYIDGKGNTENAVNSVTIQNDVTYKLTANKVKLKEGESLTLSLHTTGLAATTKVGFNVGDFSVADFSSGTPYEFSYLNASGDATKTLVFSKDNENEGMPEVGEISTIRLKDAPDQKVEIQVLDITNFVPTGNITINADKGGFPVVGSKLSVQNGIEDKNGTSKFTYQWWKVNEVGEHQNIDKAKKDTYVVGKNDKGSEIGVTVSYVDNDKFAEEVESPSISISNITVASKNIKLGTDKVDKLDGTKDSDSLSGQKGNDKLSGKDGDDILDGGEGDDTLNGDNGNDELYGGNGKDTLNGGAGNDHLNGNQGNDKLLGNDGNDTLNGGLGDDAMEGGKGDDYYVVDSTKDKLTEAKSSGNDTVETFLPSYTLQKEFENLELAGNASNGTGNAADNSVQGNISDNQLFGLDGKDTLIGGRGDDTLDGGNDTDELNGGEGSDTYLVDSYDDTIFEDANDSEAQDKVVSTANFDLSKTAGIEILELSGKNAINGTGDNSNNVLQEIDGGKTNNLLDGGAGNDSLYGQGGNDTLLGGSGNDIVDGGNGNDVVILEGQYLDYKIHADPDSKSDKRISIEYVGSNYDLNGLDEITNVESFKFADGTKSFDDLFKLFGA